jgi:putative ABC transport system permease protein
VTTVRRLGHPSLISMLTRKAWRDVWHQRGPSIAIAVVVMVGVASFVAMQSMVPHLRGSQQRYYQSAHFADLWVSVSQAPDALAAELRAIPGVRALETRVAENVVLEVPGLAGLATGRLLSHPTRRELAVNRLRVRAGRLMAPSHDDEVVISDGFATANGLAPGDTLGAVLNGRWRRLEVVGVVLTPEFVMEVQPGALFPDNRRYGILWMAEGAAQAAFGRVGAWNEATFTLDRTASEAAVIAAVDERLARYGSLGTFGRGEQLSHRYLTDEIRQAAAFGTAAPLIFLGVAAFLVNLVLARLVAAQREQIGMMKAFGITNGMLIRHYAQIALIPVLLGAIIGTGVGLWFAGLLAELYSQYYRMPDAAFTPRLGTIAASLLVTGLSALIGTVGAVRRVVRLPAAEAMRPEAPLRFRHNWFDRSWLHRRLSPMARLTVRSMLRRPARATLATLGMALSIAVVMVGSYAYDAIAVMRDVHFTEIQREDVAVTFARSEGDGALRELAHMPGVLRVEPLWSLPVKIGHGPHERRAAITALIPGARLRRVVNGQRQEQAVPGNGLLMSAALAELLDVEAGDSVQVQALTGERRVRTLPIGSLVHDLIGTGLWMGHDGMEMLAGGTAYDGAVLAVDPVLTDQLIAQLRRTPGVASVGERADVLASFDAVMRDSFGVTLVALLGFAVVLAVGVVYNTARVSLSERSRELTSLRVLGFSQREVAAMLFGELAVLGALAVPLGFAIGAGLAAAMAAGMSSELFRLPFTLAPRTYGWSVVVLVVAGMASSLLVRRRLDHLDLVAVLKTRE